jgi:hypothetical protein
MLADEAGAFEDGDVLLDRREAHRVVLGQLCDALLAVDRPAHDVSPGAVQCPEDAVVVEACIYTTIRLYICLVKLTPFSISKLLRWPFMAHSF